MKVLLSLLFATALAGAAVVAYLVVSPSAPVPSPASTDQVQLETTTRPIEAEENADHELIFLENPEPDQVIESPLVIRGEAKGTWFFEGDFPVILTDWNGLIIAETYATALDDWMTEDFVAFEATLDFDKPDFGERGSLILQKDNPSGLPEHDDAYEITIFFE